MIGDVCLGLRRETWVIGDVCCGLRRETWVHVVLSASPGQESELLSPATSPSQLLLPLPPSWHPDSLQLMFTPCMPLSTLPCLGMHLSPQKPSLTTQAGSAAILTTLY